jgi:hypothetical protein
VKYIIFYSHLWHSQSIQNQDVSIAKNLSQL